MTNWPTDWSADLRYALRGWVRQPTYVAIAVLSLAAGIGLNTAVFSLVNTIFLQSIRGVPEPDRVATVGPRVTFATYRDLRERLSTLNEVAAHIWKIVDAPTSVDRIVEEICREFDVPPDQAAHDVVMFLDALESAGLIASIPEVAANR